MIQIKEPTPQSRQPFFKIKPIKCRFIKTMSKNYYVYQQTAGTIKTFGITDKCQLNQNNQIF